MFFIFRLLCWSTVWLRFWSSWCRLWWTKMGPSSPMDRFLWRGSSSRVSGNLSVKWWNQSLNSPSSLTRWSWTTATWPYFWPLSFSVGVSVFIIVCFTVCPQFTSAFLRSPLLTFGGGIWICEWFGALLLNLPKLSQIHCVHCWTFEVQIWLWVYQYFIGADILIKDSVCRDTEMINMASAALMSWMNRFSIYGKSTTAYIRLAWGWLMVSTDFIDS